MEGVEYWDNEAATASTNNLLHRMAMNAMIRRLARRHRHRCTIGAKSTEVTRTDELSH